MLNSIKLDNIDVTKRFWELADITKATEKYRVDKNLKYLKYLKFAPLEILKKILIQYRFFTHYYIADLAILISKLPFGQLKSVLSEILYEELGAGKAKFAHPKLYDDFLSSLKIKKEYLFAADPYCIGNLQVIQSSLHDHSWAYGVGLRGMGGECLCQIYLSVMHEYFSQNLTIKAINDSIAWQFWDIHIGEVDLHHQDIIRAAINELIDAKPNIAEEIMKGYVESKNAWDLFWDRIFKSARNPSPSISFAVSNE